MLTDLCSDLLETLLSLRIKSHCEGRVTSREELSFFLCWTLCVRFSLFHACGIYVHSDLRFNAIANTYMFKIITEYLRFQHRPEIWQRNCSEWMSSLRRVGGQVRYSKGYHITRYSCARIKSVVKMANKD